MPTAHSDKKKAKEDEEAYEEARSTLKGLLNKMMNSRTYPTTRSGGDKKVQDKAEGGTKQDDNLQGEEKKEERKDSKRQDEEGNRDKILAKGGQVIQ